MSLLLLASTLPPTLLVKFLSFCKQPVHFLPSGQRVCDVSGHISLIDATRNVCKRNSVIFADAKTLPNRPARGTITSAASDWFAAIYLLGQPIAGAKLPLQQVLLLQAPSG